MIEYNMAKFMFSYFDENLQRVVDTCCPNPPKGFGEQHYTHDSPL